MHDMYTLFGYWSGTMAWPTDQLTNWVVYNRNFSCYLWAKQFICDAWENAAPLWRSANIMACQVYTWHYVRSMSTSSTPHVQSVMCIVLCYVIGMHVTASVGWLVSQLVSSVDHSSVGLAQANLNIPPNVLRVALIVRVLIISCTRMETNLRSLVPLLFLVPFLAGKFVLFYYYY